MISFLWTVGHPKTESHPTSASHHTISSTCSGDTKSACNGVGQGVDMGKHEGWLWGDMKVIFNGLICLFVDSVSGILQK